MTIGLLSTRINAASMASLRDRARQLGELFGLDKLQRTRFITAVSEIARNTVQYAGEGTLAFLFAPASEGRQHQELVARFSDQGPGIADLDAVLRGGPLADGRQRLGITGTRRLVDRLDIECPAAGGTVVTLAMTLPRASATLSGADVAQRIEQLARRRPQTPLEELERQNREMLDTLEELRQRQNELQLADTRKNQFLSTLAHELRNPLNTLHMTLEILGRQSQVDPEDLARRRGVMGRQVQQLTRLVDDLMDVSRVSQGKVELDRRPHEFHALVTDALETTSAAISRKNHTVSIGRHDGELWVRADRTRLVQVLGNVISNAARYTPENGRINIDIRREAANAVVDIADNGIGIPAHLLPQVFDLFVQGDARLDGVHGGLGVGLTLVQRLMAEHGGTVRAASAGAGRGSTFTITMPLG